MYTVFHFYLEISLALGSIININLAVFLMVTSDMLRINTQCSSFHK